VAKTTDSTLFSTSSTSVELLTADRPSAPTGLVTATQNELVRENVVVAWTAPSDNGDPITGYTIAWTDGTSALERDATVEELVSLTTELTNLVPGTNYDITVAATNSIGKGDASDSIAITPGLRPSGCVLRIDPT